MGLVGNFGRRTITEGMSISDTPTFSYNALNFSQIDQIRTKIALE